ncbi:DMT family transporter [Flavobacteriaceae bacterium M23B6Z8]
MDKRTLAILAAFGASTIYALNHVIAKDVMPLYIKPYGFIFLRVSGAAVLFLLISSWGPKERIAKADWLRLVACALFGMVINMLMFFKGLSLSTPINSAVIITISPILLLILSAIWIKERVTWLKIIGVFIGLAGALTLVLFGAEIRQDAPNIPLGNTLFIINATSYSIYLIIVRPLTKKYHTLTLMKWLFLIAVVINFPITISEFNEVEWRTLPFEAVWKMVFVVVGTTFLTYLLNLYALKELPATTIGAFIYLQPLLTIVFAAILGADSLNTVKIIAASLVFAGVYMVTKKAKT